MSSTDTSDTQSIFSIDSADFKVKEEVKNSEEVTEMPKQPMTKEQLRQEIKALEARIDKDRKVIQTEIRKEDIDYIRSGKLPSSILSDVMSIILTLMREKPTWHYGFEYVFYERNFYFRLCSLSAHLMTTEDYYYLKAKLRETQYTVNEIVFYPNSIKRLIRHVFALLDWYVCDLQRKEYIKELEKVPMYEPKKPNPQPINRDYSYFNNF